MQALPNMELMNAAPQIPPTLMESSVELPELPVITTLAMDGEPAPAVSEMRQVAQSLGVYCRDLFSKAKSARQTNGVDIQMMRAKRARALQYEPEKLNAIRALMGGQSYDPPFVPVIETKCRDIVSWLLAVPADENMWELEAEAMPELPEEVKQAATYELRAQIAEEIIGQNMDMLQNDPASLQPLIDKAIAEALPKHLDYIMLKMKRKARELVDRLSLHVGEQLNDGGWREELEKCYYDIATYPACFLKGPIPKKVKIPTNEYDPETGMQKLKIVEKVIDTYRRVSPMNVYPAPDSIGIEDGDLFEVDAITPGDLYNCIGQPGYNSDAIRRVLQTYRSTGLHEWVQFDSERSTIDKNGVAFNLGSGSKIDIVCGWVSVQGSILLGYGMGADVITDPEKEYSAWVYFVENEVIMALLNPDELGRKPYYKASFMDDPDKFWPMSLPDVLWDYQSIANAVIRACGHNVAFASGPVTEVNKDRLAPGESPNIHPYATKLSSKAQIGENSPLLRFYQARLIVGELSSFYTFLMQQADTDSGVPHYIAGGAPNQAGAGKNTVGGMQMLRTDAARGLEQVRGNISKGIITKSVEAQYYQILKYDGIRTIGAVKVKSRGTEWIAIRDQQSQRMSDALAVSNNPVDMQIFGMRGRQEMWREKLKSMHIDDTKLLPEDRDLIANLTGGEVTNTAPGEQGAPGIPIGQPEATSAAETANEMVGV